MNVLAPRVLVSAAVVASPALYHGFVTGTVAMETALQRYLVVVVVAWLALSVLEAMVGPPPAPERPTPRDPASVPRGADGEK